MEIKNTDVLIVGTGASGLFAALHIPQDQLYIRLSGIEIAIITGKLGS